MGRREYTERREEDREVLRRLEIQHLEKMIAETPKEEREAHKLVLGDRTFTLDEILAEAKAGTEFGLKFLEMQSRSRLERLRRRL